MARKHAANGRCIGVTKAGERCRLQGVLGSDPPLCVRHEPGAKRVPRSERRCTALNVRGERCKKLAEPGSAQSGIGGQLCGVHKRPLKHFAPKKVRCGALKGDGTQCGAWATKKKQESARPVCSYHGGQRVAQSVPPTGQRCTAMANSGEQCRNWAMQETLDGMPLCDVHGGMSGWQKGECPVEWPLPEAMRCKEKRVDGGRCQARAVVDGLCVNHAGLTGFELNNEVAWKSGLYARPTIEEKNARIAFKFGWSTVKLSRELDNGDLGLELWQMIVLNRFLVRDLLENLSDSEINRSWGVFVRHVRLIFRGAELIGKLLVEAKSANGDREEATRTFLNDVGKYALHSPEIDDSSDE